MPLSRKYRSANVVGVVRHEDTPPGALHRRGDGLRAEKASDEIDVDDAAKNVFAELIDLRPGATHDAGAVDQRVDPSESPLGGGGERGALVGSGDVGWHDD